MEEIKRGWWLYCGVQVIIWGIVLAVLLGTAKLLERSWGLDFDNGGTKLAFNILSLIVFVVTKRKAERVAKAACRAAKLPVDGYDALRVSRWLDESAPDAPPVSDPPSIYCPLLSVDWLFALWACRILGVVFVVGAICSLFDRDWATFGLAIVGAPLWLWGAAATSRDPSVLQVNEMGIRSRLQANIVAWDSVEHGWIATNHGFNSKVTSEWLCLQNSHRRRIFEVRIDNLPPDVRADLFAWLRARTGLREPNRHSEIFAWLESISGIFAHR